MLRYAASIACAAIVAGAVWLTGMQPQETLSAAPVAPPPLPAFPAASPPLPATPPVARTTRPAMPSVPAAFRGLSDRVRCLAQAIYFEARGETSEGQLAVAQVVLNRTVDPRYPDKVCDVVFQNADRRHRCQFSFACDGKSDRPKNMAAWAEAVRLAKVVNSGPVDDVTAKATHYHADYAAPAWADKLTETVKIGRHHFYRTAAATR